MIHSIFSRKNSDVKMHKNVESSLNFIYPLYVNRSHNYCLITAVALSKISAYFSMGFSKKNHELKGCPKFRIIINRYEFVYIFWKDKMLRVMKTETNHLKQIKIQLFLFEKNHFIYKIIKTRATKKNIAYSIGESLSKFSPKKCYKSYAYKIF